MFGNLFGKKEKSANKAHSRLKLAINSDRINLSPEKSKQLEVEMRELLNKYITVKEIDMNKDYHEMTDFLNISIEIERP